MPFNVADDDLYDLFGKYGAIRQIRVGTAPDTKGTAYVVYEDILDARNACEHLSGFNVGGRYITVLYYNPQRLLARMDVNKKREELDKLKQQHNIAMDES
ncbi:pre-mRNA branch site protein p14 [Capsaspora owczarzaki ATCC 30864]|uniref:Pre-mRNA branch site protein p14 n=2 Tax=Capsaspora owczarzaki (strain ATCC 30864) TaxID=595528 RepID=A0A0D2WPD0_CAPO3|nr:pre-mRNA branch site protein p14 [Capsaspora owczarzaki ATCC 30864]